MLGAFMTDNKHRRSQAVFVCKQNVNTTEQVKIFENLSVI